MLGLLYHTFSKSSNISVKKFLYLLLVRSQIITYGSLMWRPYLIKDIKFIEQIQCRATKFTFILTTITVKCLNYSYDVMFFVKSLKASS